MADSAELPVAAPAPEPVADSRSMEQRIAEKFIGKEPVEETAPIEADSAAEAPEADAAPAETAEPDVQEIEYEGVKYSVPKELKDAFMHKSDYTRKTQEIANTRREVEAVQTQLQLAQAENAFTHSISQEVQTIALIDARSKQLMENWASLSADEKQDQMLLDKQREQINQSIQSKRGEFLRGQEQALNELRTKAMDAVAKTIPGWSEKVKADIVSHAKLDGYTEQELGNIFDPRHARTLWKAMQYDKLSEKARSVVKATPVGSRTAACSRWRQSSPRGISG